MDERHQPSTTRSSCRRVAAQPVEAVGNEPRSRAWQNASKLFCPPGIMRCKGLICELVQLPRLRILFNLLIPLVRIIPVEPLSKSRYLRPAQLPHLNFEPLDCRHGLSLLCCLLPLTLSPPAPSSPPR